MMKSKREAVTSLLKNNKKVMENYFFMTVLQILNSLFYILIYPFLIRTLGAEYYGLFVFASAIVNYFITFVNFGFDMPAVKMIAQNIEDKDKKEQTISSVFTAKLFLSIISLIFFSVLIFYISSLRNNYKIFFVCFAQVISHIIFPQWYFQGIQKMRIVTYIQLGFKLLSLPFIFIFISDSSDLLLFVSIVMLFSLLGAFVAFLIINLKDKLRFKLASVSSVKIMFKEAMPFFASNSLNVIKQQSAVVILGSFFSMSEVALYDLAVKIFTVPTMLISSINSALYPKLVSIKDLSNRVKKIIQIENIIAIGIIVFLIIFGKWIILFMGGAEMLDAYQLLIILSFGTFGQLTVGAICLFIFIPQNKTKYIAKNQVLAISIFGVVVTVGLLITNSIFVIPLALTISVLSELAYTSLIVKQNKMYN